jgi:hypothetical protein
MVNVVSSFVVRPAHAVPPNVQKWAQYCSPYSVPGEIPNAAMTAGAINPDLKNRGLEGWELIAVSPLQEMGHTSALTEGL